MPPPAPARAPPRRLGGTFLAGSGGRLLPAAVPFGYFGAAVLFQAWAWVALAFGAPAWADGPGGLGWPLAALHAVTLGVLACSAMGASLQMLPVATRQPLVRAGLAGWPGLLLVPGTLGITLGMGLARPLWLAAGAGVAGVALAGWGVLLALNLRGAHGMPGVVLHGWGALGALVLLLVSAGALVALWLGVPPWGRTSGRALHLAAGVFGVMGLLVLGLSTILLPMFAIGPVPAERVQLAGGAAGALAVALAAIAAFLPGTPALGLRAAALTCGVLALALHLRTMRRTLREGLRKDLGGTGTLLQVAWAAAACTLALGAVVVALDALDAAALAGPEGAGSPAGGGSEAGRTAGRLFVVAAVAGWLLTFLIGVLHRILPFLAAMHAARGQRRGPTPSMLTLEPALALHRRAHLAALALLLLGTALRSAPVLWAAAAAGLAGALAFAAFFAVLCRRLVHEQRSGG
ncbi:MAG: hypothetical protein KIT17_12050 [Rubrivivax sp.]|nr:hypothetical protein [Rubrivivax sp.]